MHAIQPFLPGQKQHNSIKHFPLSMERVNWRVNDFLAHFAIGRTTFYELVNAGYIKIIKCCRTTLIPHSEAVSFQVRLEEGV